jgi:hypothetical protein
MVEDEIANDQHGGLRKPSDVLPKYLRGRGTSGTLIPRACRRLARHFPFTY